MKHLFFLTLMFWVFVSCQQQRMRDINQVNIFLNSVKEDKISTARSMISASLSKIGKDSLMFIEDMKLVQRLINKNGVSNDYKIKKFESGIISRTIEVDLGTENKGLSIRYILCFDIVKATSQDSIYSYRLQRIIG